MNYYTQQLKIKFITQQLKEACKQCDIFKFKDILRDNIDFNIHFNSEYFFKLSCCYGCIDMTKYLIYTYNDIDIHAENDNAFLWACRNGKIDIVEYLINLCEYKNSKIDISISVREIIHYVSDFGVFEILKYLNFLIKHNYRITHLTDTLKIYDKTSIFFIQKYIKYFYINNKYYNACYICNNILILCYFTNNEIKLNNCYIFLLTTNK